MRRAAHQLLDNPRVHDDPLALAILGDAQAAAMRADPRRFEDGPVGRVLRAFLAVRSRLAEDALAQAVAAGVRRYVLLGAGLDTFALGQDVQEEAADELRWGQGAGVVVLGAEGHGVVADRDEAGVGDAGAMGVAAGVPDRNTARVRVKLRDTLREFWEELSLQACDTSLP